MPVCGAASGRKLSIAFGSECGQCLANGTGARQVGRMRFKDFQLDFEAMLSEAVYGHGFLHYGYWPDGRPEVPSALALGAAQQAWFDRMAETIPEGVATILDVGSGTGANALALTRRGYRLECVCPSEQLNAMARAKLPKEVQVHASTFEALDLPRRFDLCLFGESFHYIELGSALDQIDRYATGHAIVFDYFRRRDAGEGGRRGTHAEFREALAARPGWRVAHDEDVTDAILPTFFVLDHVKNTHLAPFLTRFRTDLRRRRPIVARLTELAIGRRLERFVRPSRREATFGENYEYRLIRLDRAPAET
jgi:SAM-dependent methyltransferase